MKRFFIIFVNLFRLNGRINNIEDIKIIDTNEYGFSKEIIDNPMAHSSVGITSSLNNKDNKMNYDYLDEFNFYNYCNEHKVKTEDIYSLVHNNLLKLENFRGVPYFAYYAYSLNMGAQKIPLNASINELDIDMIFKILEHKKFQHSNEVNFLLNTSGGSIKVAQQILAILRLRFKKVNIVIPREAASSGTIIACGCDEIIVLEKSVLTQTNPKLYSTDTYNIKKINIFSHIIFYMFNSEYRNNYGINPYSKAYNAEKSVNKLLYYLLNTHAIKMKKSLSKYFVIKKIVKRLMDFTIFYSHEMPIPLQELKDLGLNIQITSGAEKDLINEFDFLAKQLFINNNISKLFVNSESSLYIKASYSQ